MHAKIELRYTSIRDFFDGFELFLIRIAWQPVSLWGRPRIINATKQNSEIRHAAALYFEKIKQTSAPFKTKNAIILK